MGQAGDRQSGEGEVTPEGRSEAPGFVGRLGLGLDCRLIGEWVGYSVSQPQEECQAQGAGHGEHGTK